MTRPADIHLITDLDELQRQNGAASDRTRAKKIRKLDRHARNFIARSPFLVIATVGPDGSDASPRGDAPGFVQVLDDTTLLLPERPGNRLADSMSNIVHNNQVALLFFIPGMDETLRVNGAAWLTDHAPYRELLAANGKTPGLAIVVDVEELYFHCPKAFIRAKLWDPAQYMNRADLPSLGRMILDQMGGATDDATVANVDRQLARDVRDNLY